MKFKIRKLDIIRKTCLDIKDDDGQVIKMVIFNNRKEAINFAGGLYLKYPGIIQETEIKTK